MKKLKIVYTIIAAIVALSLSITTFAMCSTVNTVKADTTFSEVNIPSEPAVPETSAPETEVETEIEEPDEEPIVLDVVEVERVEPTTFDEAKVALQEAQNRATYATNIYEGLINLGYDEEHPAFILAQTLVENTTADCEYYQALYKDFEEIQKWETRKQEYPVATQIWLYMKDLGWSDEVCAGIMGNIMAEVGGQTLNIQYTLYSKDGVFYGMCQWHKSYYSEIHGADLQAQCDFLRDTIQKEYLMFGKIYAKGMNYEQFLKMTDPAEIALCFAKVYERCGSGSYKVRQSNAVKAYEYFTK